MFLANFITNLPLNLQTILYVVIMVVGAVILIKSCDVFVDNSTIVAKKFRISPLIIGLTIVSIGTSIPELAISVLDSISVNINGGSANIAIGNVVGSNIANLLIVLSFACLFHPIKIKKESKTDFSILLAITFLLVVFGVFFGINSFTRNNAILRWEAIILVALIAFYMGYLFITSKKDSESIKPLKTYEKVKIGKPILLIILMVVTIAIGGELVVEGARGVSMNLSSVFGLDKDMAETLVGLTVVAIGTSLPELVTTLIASKKKQNEMAIGNVIGSNIFNIIFVLGISGVVAPLTISSYAIVDLFVVLFSTLLVFIFVLKGKLSKKHSITLLTIYGLYLLYLVLRTILVF